MSVNTLLAIRTDFSIGESSLPSEKVADMAAKTGQKHIAFADTMNVSAMIDITRGCQKHGIEAHTGVRLRIVADVVERGNVGKKFNREAYYLKAWAKNEDGIKEIYKLLSRATEEDRFFYVNRLILEDVFEHLSSENVLITTGDSRSIFSRPDHEAILGMVLDHYPDTMVELVPIPTPYYERLNLNALAASKKVSHGGYIVSMPTLFDFDGYDAMYLNMAIQNRSDIRKPFTCAQPYFKDFEPKTPEQLVALIKETVSGMRVADPSVDASAFSEALRSGNSKFLEATPFRWTKQPVALPQLAADAPKAVLEACKVGIKTRLTVDVFGYHPTPAQISELYIPRLKYELEVLTNLGFCDYFLVVADLVNWAKSAGIMVGPGRGSIGGSLIAFLMGITEVDPIRFGLLFERFINPSRNDLPDADLDFMSTRREEIITYLEGKYGKDFVAGINNYSVLGSASAVKDVARVMGVDMALFPIGKFIPKIHGQAVPLEDARKDSAEIAKFAEVNPNVWKGALSVQGVMRSFGRHAAGTIVSGVPVRERAVVERDGTSRKVNWDMRVCEDQGLVKFDVLGLSTLDTISRATRYIWERHMKRIDINAIPLDDEKTLQAFSNGETIGIFQFEGGAARRILKDMASSSLLTFDDLVAANALNRPGPIEAGLVKDYVESRSGSRTIIYPHEFCKPALQETFGVICYQEQVMQIAVDLCGFSLSEADKLRKGMGKKDAALMASFRKQFVDGAVAKAGMDAKEADDLFTTIEGFAGYAFNKSHAAEYSLISYQCMWLKVHYPVEFYAASLSTVDEAKLQVIVTDATKHGIKLMAPDVNISTNEFVIGNDTTLFMPFNRIKGVSDKGGQAIVEARNKEKITYTEKEKVLGSRKSVEVIKTKPVLKGRFTSLEDFLERVEKRLVNTRVVQNLDTVGAFARVIPGQQPSDCESRRKDQMKLLPGLMTGLLMADREIPTDKFTLAELDKLWHEIQAVDDKVVHVSPAVGKNAKFMVVFDGATQDEEAHKQFTGGSSFTYCAAALKVCDLKRNDAYWTGLIKRKKGGKSISVKETNTYKPFLDREIEMLKPPVILTLGSASARYFVPDLKGDIMDHAGSTFYSEKHDAMIVIGFNPQMCHFSMDKFDTLVEVFDLVRAMVIPSI